jgi:tRNA(fMet)-specific endonuclease VapC
MAWTSNKLYLLDTNIVSAYWKRDRLVVNHLSEVEYYLPAIVVGELMKGALRSDRRAHLLRNLRILLNVVEVIPVDSFTAEYYGEMVAQMEEQGTRLEDNDLWIAATARQHDLTLATRDAHFDRIPGLTVERW